MLKTLLESLFKWRMQPSSMKELDEADVVIPVAFGLREFDPGISNRDLGKLSNGFCRMLDAPAVGRWLIAECIEERYRLGVTGSTQDRNNQMVPVAEDYVDTYRELAQAVEICKRHGKKKPLILAEPDHYWRVVKTAEAFGYFEKILIADTSSVRKDPESLQMWTRYYHRFRFYERFLSRPWYLAKGYIKL